MASPAETPSDSYERILAAARALFAEQGFHGTSTRAIAAAAGLNIATMHYHVGSKEDLYREVFRRLFRQEYALIARFVADVDDAVVADPAALRSLLEQLVDALVDMTREQPETARLWLRRWLERDETRVNLEEEVSLPLYEMILNLLERARQAGAIQPGDIEPRLLLISFTWMLYGYFTGGPLAWNAALADPLEPEQIAAFKRFLHQYIARMLFSGGSP